MMLNRRDVMKVMAGAVAAFVLPAPRRQIDLLQFCQKREWTRFDLRLPYEVEDWTYATDARICVRVRPILGDVVQHKGKIPPFDTLSWNHERLTGWRELPKLEPLLASDSDCPACDGTGYVGGVLGTDCPSCDATGSEWVESNYHMGHAITCRTCKGRGTYAPCEECHACKGNAIGDFPSIVDLNGQLFDVRLYEKARQLGCEYIADNWNAIPDHPMLKFRFDEGIGLLMGLGKTARKRLQ